MQGFVNKIQWKEIVALSEVFQKDGLEIAKEVGEYFWGLLELSTENHCVLTYADFIELWQSQDSDCEISEEESLMTYDYLMNDAGEVTKTFLLVHSTIGRPRSGIASNLVLFELFMQMCPEVDGEEEYRQQLIEKEAFCFMHKVYQYIQDMIAARQDVVVAERFNHTL